MTLDLPNLSAAANLTGDPWESAELWASTWPPASGRVLGVTPAGDVIGRTPHDSAPRLLDHVVALPEARRGR